MFGLQHKLHVSYESRPHATKKRRQTSTHIRSSSTIATPVGRSSHSSKGDVAPTCRNLDQSIQMGILTKLTTGFLLQTQTPWFTRLRFTRAAAPKTISAKGAVLLVPEATAVSWLGSGPWNSHFEQIGWVFFHVRFHHWWFQNLKFDFKFWFF